MDEKVEIIVCSSDHILLDITESEMNYEIGDTVEFVLDYVSVLRCMTSNHVRKVYI